MFRFRIGLGTSLATWLLASPLVLAQTAFPALPSAPPANTAQEGILSPSMQSPPAPNPLVGTVVGTTTNPMMPPTTNYVPGFNETGPLVSQHATPYSGVGCGVNGCGGPLGANGPVSYDIYVSPGIGWGLNSRFLNSGLDVTTGIKAGGRSLYFSPNADSAWVLDVGGHYLLNQGSGGQNPFVFNNNSFTVRQYNRSGVHGSIGQEHYLRGPGFVSFNSACTIAVGWDVGGRWETTSVHMNQLTNSTSGFARVHAIASGYTIGAHVDMIIPQGGWSWVAGARVEYASTYTNPLPGQDFFNELYLFLHAGVRY
jgi:hypothetical protein